MFFISCTRFDDMLREKNTQIGDRDRQIAELEADRRMLLDRICLFGVLLFSSSQNALDQRKVCACAKPTAQPEDPAEAKDNPGGPGDDPAQSSLKADPAIAAQNSPDIKPEEPQPKPNSEPAVPETNAEPLDVATGLKSEAAALRSPKAEPGDADPGLKSEATGLRSPEARALRSRRPSFIMRWMGRLAEKQYLERIHPAKAAEQQREGVINQLNVAHMEAVKAGLSRV